MNITTDQLEIMAYRLIMNRINIQLSDSELGNYVRGVTDLQRELYIRVDAETETTKETDFNMNDIETILSPEIIGDENA